MTPESRDKLDSTLTPILLNIILESEREKRASWCVSTSDRYSSIYSVEGAGEDIGEMVGSLIFAASDIAAWIYSILLATSLANQQCLSLTPN